MKKIVLVLIAIFYLNTGKAQTKHEIATFVGGGLSTLIYKNPLGSKQNGLGGNLGVGYSYYFNESWGIGTGLEIGLYQAKSKINEFADQYETADFLNDLFEFRTQINDYQDKQRFTLLNIPIMLRYQTKTENKFYAAVGGKIGIPLSGTYTVKTSSVKNSGYYAYENVEYTTQEFMGFGSFSNKENDGVIDTKVAIMASIETGMKWALPNKNALYTGVYLDYGLNNILKNENQMQLVRYDTHSPKLFYVNSVLNADYSNNGRTKQVVEKIVPLTIGLKIQMTWGLD